MIWLLSLSLGSLTGMLLAIRAQNATLAAALKIITSGFLGIYSALLLAASPNLYAWLITTGIFLGVIGDGLLLVNNKKAFLNGMLAFLLGHCCYMAAFLQYDIELAAWLVSMIVIGFAMLAVFRWIKPALTGSLMIAVPIYMLVLGLMWSLALSLRVDEEPTLVALGASLFAVSDFFVASNRFKKPQVLTRLVGLPLYYGGQFILATSILLLQADSPWPGF